MIIGKNSQSGTTIKLLCYSLLACIALIVCLPHLIAGFIGEEAAKSYLKKNYDTALLRYEHAKFNNYRSLFAHNTKNWLPSQLMRMIEGPKIETLNLNISFENLEKIKHERERLLASDSLYQKFKGTYVPARIDYQGKKLKARIRLKGGALDHIRDSKKWSFRVKLKNDNAMLGMRHFSIQAPKTRQYQGEALFLDMAKALNLLAVDYHFMNVSINGESIGLMAVEEYFAKELLESQKRRESVIFKFAKDRIRDSYFTLKSHPAYEKEKQRSRQRIYNPNLATQGAFSGIGLSYLNPLSAPIEFFEPGSIAKSEWLLKQKKLALGLMRGVIAGNIPPEEVFDGKKFGAFFALQWLWGTNHMSSFRNQRFYLNPFTLKIEPIVYDAGTFIVMELDRVAKDVNRFDQHISRVIFKSKEVEKYFKRYSELLHNNIHNKEWRRIFMKKENALLRVLKKEFINLPPVYLAQMQAHAAKTLPLIKNNTYHKSGKELLVPYSLPSDITLPEVLQAYIVKDDNDYQLELSNSLDTEVRVSELNIITDRKQHKILEDSAHIILPPTRRTASPHIQIVSLGESLPNNAVIQGKAKPKGQAKTYSFTATPYAKALRKHPLSATSEILKRFPFLKKIDKNALLIKKGTWDVNEFIIFPKNYSLHITEGTELNFHQEAGLIVRGAVHIQGSADAPVVFKAATNTFQGVAVLEASDTSTLSHVEFQNTTAAQHQNWMLTGGVTFYRSDVNIKDTYFNGTQAEDALNIVDSTFTLQNSRFQNTRSDAFDGDSSRGEVLYTEFRNIMGDAVDVSDSRVKVAHSSFYNISDKAISIGEKSYAQIHNCSVQESGSGIVAKDASVAYANKIAFLNITHAHIMAYQKKAAYGPAELHIQQVTTNGNPLQAQAQKRSRVTLDGLRVKSQKLDIEQLYKSGYMKK